MTIGLDGDYMQFEYEHALRPGQYADPRVRMWFHELLHLWQLLGSGFLANLACDQVAAVEAFERTHEPGDVTDLLERFATKDAGSGFSALDLHEALARYWEIHVLNPVRILKSYEDNGVDISTYLRQRNLTWEDLMGDPARGERIAGRFSVEEGTRPYTGKAFDLLMMIEPSYAEPYRLMLSHFDSRESVIFFPLVGHFALQTRRPERMFTALLQALANSDLRSALSGKDIHEMWRAVYPRVFKLAFASAIKTGGSALTPGWQVLPARAGARPILGHYAALLRWVRSRHGQFLDFALALPGDPECRQVLALFFLPAATVFDDGEYSRAPSSMTKLGLVMKAVPDLVPAGSNADLPALDDLLDAEALASAALDMRRRARALRKRALLASYGVA